MKIVNNPAELRYSSSLHQIKPGQCVEFERVFNTRHSDTAKFLVLHVPGEYIAEKKQYKDGVYRIMVANLETGLTSLVNAERGVRRVDAVVVLDD